MEELQDELLVAELHHRCDIGMPECVVRSIHEGAQLIARELVRRYVKREHCNGKIDEGVGVPLLLPVPGQRWYVLRDIQPAIGCKTGQDSLKVGRRVFRTRWMMKREGLIDLFKGKKIIPTSSRKILHDLLDRVIRPTWTVFTATMAL